MKRMTKQRLTALGVVIGALFLVFFQASSAKATIAYLWPAGQAGAQAFTGSIGMDFTVNSPIDVTGLGVFDHLGDGITGTLEAVIWDLSTGLAVPGASATSHEKVRSCE